MASILASEETLTRVARETSDLGSTVCARILITSRAFGARSYYLQLRAQWQRQYWLSDSNTERCAIFHAARCNTATRESFNLPCRSPLLAIIRGRENVPLWLFLTVTRRMRDARFAGISGEIRGRAIISPAQQVCLEGRSTSGRGPIREE